MFVSAIISAIVTFIYFYYGDNPTLFETMMIGWVVFLCGLQIDILQELKEANRK